MNWSIRGTIGAVVTGLLYIYELLKGFGSMIRLFVLKMASCVWGLILLALPTLLLLIRLSNWAMNELVSRLKAFSSAGGIEQMAGHVKNFVDAGIFEWVEVVNYVFPISDLFVILSLLAAWKIMCMLIRFVKAMIWGLS